MSELREKILYYKALDMQHKSMYLTLEKRAPAFEWTRLFFFLFQRTLRNFKYIFHFQKQRNSV